MASSSRMFLVVGILAVVIANVCDAKEVPFRLEKCKDAVVNCHEYDKDFCTLYPFWAKINCPQFCKLCSCPSGWLYSTSDDSCIKVFGLGGPMEQKSWEGAVGYCKNVGTELVIIKDQAKNGFVLAQLKTQFYFWIGLHNIESKGFNFTYVDGTAMGDYHPWVGQNPDDTGGDEKCVHMYPHKPDSTELNGGWNDYPCTKILPFVCQTSTTVKITIS